MQVPFKTRMQVRLKATTMGSFVQRRRQTREKSAARDKPGAALESQARNASFRALRAFRITVPPDLIFFSITAVLDFSRIFFSGSASMAG